jgi:hypothetical protein
MPRLLYVKEPAPDREPRLAELLEHLMNEAVGSFRTFNTAAELGRLVRDDLAALLSERFAAGQPALPPAAAGPARLPVDTTSLVGREARHRGGGRPGRCGRAVGDADRAGGIGKTRLAVTVGERLRDRFDPGLAFADFAGVTRPEVALTRLSNAVRDGMGGESARLAALVEQFGDRPWLLVLDGLEQVAEVAPDLEQLLAGCPGLAILAASRRVLRLRAEQEYPVPPLALPELLNGGTARRRRHRPRGPPRCANAVCPLPRSSSHDVVTPGTVYAASARRWRSSSAAIE